MPASTSLLELHGEWAGVNRLWLTPGEPAHESPAAAEVDISAYSRYLTISYTWVFEGETQEGLLTLLFSDESGMLQATWVDTWHMAGEFMLLTGSFEEGEGASLLGSYEAPPGPDWGWRIELVPDDGAFRMLMHNITPEGEESLAVEAAFTRG